MNLRVSLTLVALLAPTPAYAGMPMFSLTDIATLRLDALSFFGVVLLVLSAVVLRLWNGLRRDVEALPLLTYPRALALVGLVGLALFVVLTMISGARELMTPGAWERTGALYRLAPVTDAEALLAARRARMESLRSELWTVAAAGGGELPLNDLGAELPRESWLTLHPHGHRFVYVGGHAIDRGADVVAYEPGVYGGRRLVLLTDGTVELLPFAELEARLGR